VKSSFAKILVISVVIIGLMSICIAVNARNVSNARHPNLAKAQTYVERAIGKISDAQAANEYDMEGHAARAKGLLQQAYDEIKLAALVANKNK